MTYDRRERPSRTTPRGARTASQASLLIWHRSVSGVPRAAVYSDVSMAVAFSVSSKPSMMASLPVSLPLDARRGRITTPAAADDLVA